MKKIIIFLLISVSLNAGAQTSALVDSLEAVLKTQGNDTNRVKTLNELAWEYSSINLKKGEVWCQTSIRLSNQLNYIKGRSSAYNTLANIYSDEGNNKEALKLYVLGAQDKESLKDEKGAATIYSNIAIVYRTVSDSANALRYNRLALGKREQLKDKVGMSDSYNNMGNVYRDYARYEEALDAYNKALKIRLEIGDKRRVAFTYNNLGNIYDDRSDYSQSLDYNYKAAQLLEEVKDINSLIRVYNNIGIINKKLKNYADALKYSTMALDLSEKTGNKSYRSSIYENLGGVYIERKEFGNARTAFDKGMALADTSGDRQMQAYFYAALSICYENEHKQAMAEASLKRAIEIVREHKSDRDLVRYSINLADYYSRQHRTAEVEGLLDQSIQLSKKKGFTDQLKKAYKIYAGFYQESKVDLAQSTKYYKLYCSLNDSLFSEDLTRKFADMQIRYETEKKEKEIKILTQQEQIKSLRLEDQLLQLDKRKYLLFASGAALLLLFLFGYGFFSRQRSLAARVQQAAVMEAEENERMRMAKDIHDDLGSGLSKIKFLTEIVASKTAADPEIQSAIQSISDKAVFLVDNMRDLIWALNPENTTLENLVARMREYSSDYLNDFPVEFIQQIDLDNVDIQMTKEAHRNIFFILKECLQNIVKHALATEVVLVVQVSGESFLLSVSDNGKGMDPLGAQDGNGLLNIRHRTEALGGTLHLVSEPGKGLMISMRVLLVKIKKG